ncbi:MAG: oligosaccharide flippase family protein, partial [Phocaeicola sp.]
MTNESLKDKTAKGLLWGGFSNGVLQLLNLLFGIFLARMLTPEDYGMVGMLTIFSLIVSSLQESGFTTALANRKEVSRQDYSSVFWFSIAVSLSIYTLLFFAA